MKNNNKILTIAVVLLLLTNIGLVAFMMLGGKGKKAGDKRQGNREPFAMMVKELGMTEQQQKDYRQLKEAHFKSVRPLFDSIRAAKTAFYSLIKGGSVSDSVLNEYTAGISAKQAALERETFEHFRQVRNIFTSEQQPKYDSFLQKMMQRGKRDSSGKGKGR
jgi:protein CpxP